MKKLMLLFAFGLIIQQDVLSQDYLFPYKGDEFKPAERLFTKDHGTGIQGEGKDIIMMRYLGNNNWTNLLDQKDGTKNTDYIIRERAVYAMADGIIIGCWANAPENPRPRLPGDTDAGQEWYHPKLSQVFKEMPRGGNLLWIKHADGSKALYAHMIPGTITSNLCPNQAVFFPNPLDTTQSENMYVNVPADKQVSVVKGQFLGLTGHSGQSSQPHLHIHIEKSGNAEVMRFEEGLSKNYTEGNTPILNGWTNFASQQIPNVDVLIRPPRSVNFRMKDFESFTSDGKQMYAGILEPGNYAPVALSKSNWDDFVKGWKDIESQGNRMIDFECSMVNGLPVFAGVFEEGNYAPVALFKNNWDDFVKGWKDIESKGNRMLDFESYNIAGVQWYAGIFKPGNYAPVALFKNNWDEFVKGWKDIESQGNRMFDFESYAVGGKRIYAGIFKPGNYAPVALFKDNWDDFVKGWKDIESQGNRMLDFETYMAGLKRVYVGIFKPGTHAPVAIFSNKWEDFLITWQSFE
jgi:hypothetical protein